MQSFQLWHIPKHVQEIATWFTRFTRFIRLTRFTYHRSPSWFHLIICFKYLLANYLSHVSETEFSIGSSSQTSLSPTHFPSQVSSWPPYKLRVGKPSLFLPHFPSEVSDDWSIFKVYMKKGNDPLTFKPNSAIKFLFPDHNFKSTLQLQC